MSASFPSAWSRTARSQVDAADADMSMFPYFLSFFFAFKQLKNLSQIVHLKISLDSW